MRTTRVRIFYPADPLGVVPGGIDTFIRGMIKYAPDDLHFSLVGMTTDTQQRPTGRFRTCRLGDREFEFFPAVHVPDAGKRSRVPLSARFTLATARRRAELSRDFEVFDFHRLEPMMPFRTDPRPKNAFFHQDPKALRTAQSDILWKKLPIAYDAIEHQLVPQLSSAWCVRESGVVTLRERYPAQASTFHFVPTWVDTTVFTPGDAADRELARRRLGDELSLDPLARRIVSVGRLDSQKNPMLLLKSFATLVREGRRVALLYVGDGVLRPELEKKASELGVMDKVRFLGLRSAASIVSVLRGSDLFALSSAYEGMPMAMLEAMACGLPVATTDVGEVRRLVAPGQNGAIARDHSLPAFLDSLEDVLEQLDSYSGVPAWQATRPFRPEIVLEPLYENYMDLGERARALQRATVGVTHAPGSGTVTVKSATETNEGFPDTVTAESKEAATERAEARAPRPYPHRQRDTVIGAPIDVLMAQKARQVILDWAQAHESRYVCFCNAHSAVSFRTDARHRDALERADMVAPDGAPIAWMLRRKGHQGQQRVDGPGTMWALCADAAQRGVKVGLYGSTPDVLNALRGALRRAFPRLDVAFTESPPFGSQDSAADEATCRAINDSEVGLLFVALGCPRQERWMAEHAGRINAVMLGVGAAFDFHAGTVSRAPRWMQETGLEWLHRLASEPNRLWKRYLFTNSVFVMRGVKDLASKASSSRLRHGALATPLDSHADSSLAAWSRNMDQQYMTELAARVDAGMNLRTGRVIGFIASGPGEGTTTLASAYAYTAAAHLGRRVLLLSVHGDAGEGRPGVLQALAASQSAEAAISRRAGGFFGASLLGVDAQEADWALCRRTDLWRALRDAFDEIVMDMPAASESRTGVMASSYCDGVIVVLEAERTRAPVVDALVSSLHAVRANLLGTVLNKRRFHLPSAVYKRL